MPKPDPYKDCDCIHRPVELTESRGVIEWKVLDGDFVKKGELIAEGEINKLTIQFFAETDGILIKNIKNGGKYYGDDFSAFFCTWKEGRIGLKALENVGLYQSTLTTSKLDYFGFEKVG